MNRVVNACPNCLCTCCSSLECFPKPDFSLAQIFPLTDEERYTAPPRVLSASFADPYILVVRDDASAMVLTTDDRGEIDEATHGEALKSGKWISGSLYEDSNDILRIEYPEDSEDEAGNVLMFLLNDAGGLQVSHSQWIRSSALFCGMEGLTLVTRCFVCQIYISRYM